MADINNQKIEESINKLLLDRRSMLQAQTREMQSQLQLSLQMKALMDGMKSEEMLDRLSEAQKVIDSLAQSTKSAGTTGEEAMTSIATGAAKASTNASKLQVQTKLLAAKFPGLKSVGAAALSGLSQGFTNLLALGKGFAGSVEGIVSGMFNIGKAIISIPLGIFNKLVDKAGAFVGDMSLAKAFEDLRKEFGSFKEDVSKNVIGSFQEIRKGLTGTGLSAFQVFENFADRLKYFHEMAKGAGAQMHQFGEEIKNNAGLIAGLDKGLGVGSENIKAYMDLATVKGKTLGETMLQTANYSLQMGKEFGMSQKVLAKDISMMAKDVKNFGSLTQKEMSVASVYTRKLGIEVKSLLGLVDKFDTFEDAANSAAQLSQAFGTSVDAFKMMNEQDPAKRLDMLRQSMAAAGKTSENMSRQELKLLENTSGLDAATAKLAFSSKNQGLSYDQVRKASEKAEKKQLTQAQAMEKLADSIERVIRQGETMKGGFLAQFLEGFERGITWSKPFMSVLMNIKKALWATMQAGRQVGRMFVETFPGINKLLTSFAGMFAPEKFSGLLSGVVATFKKFFDDATKGKYSLPELVKNLQKNFFDYFDSNSSLGKDFLDSGKTLLKTFAGILGSGIKWVVETLTTGAQDLADFITDPSAFLEKLSGTGGSALSGAMGILQPLIDALSDSKLWNSLYDAFGNLLTVVFDKVVAWFKGPTFQGLVSKYWPIVAGVLFGPALVKIMFAVLLESVASLFMGGMGKALGAVLTSGLSKLSASTTVAGGAGKAGGPAALAKSVPNQQQTAGLSGTIKELSKLKASEVAKAGVNAVILSTFIATSLVALVTAVAISAKIVESFNVDVKSFIMVLGALAGVAVAMIPMMVAIKIASKVPMSEVLKGLLAIGTVVAAMALTLVAVVGAFALFNLKTSDAKNIGEAMVSMGVVFIEAGAVVAIALGLGAILTALGPFAAVALVGLAAMGVVIGAMASAIIAIMVALDKVDVRSGFEEKVKAFGVITSAVANLAGALAKILEASRPSFADLFRGNASMQKNMKELNKFIENLVGDDGGGIMGIIKSVTDAVQKLGTSSKLLKAGETLASILNAVATLSQSLAPPADSRGWLDTLIENHPAILIANKLVGKEEGGVFSQMQDYIENMQFAISGIMISINDTLSKIGAGTISESMVKGAQVFGSIASAAVSIIKAITPSPELLSSMKSAIKGQLGTKIEKFNVQNLKAMGEYMNSVMAGVSPMIKVLTGDVIDTVISAAQGLDPKKLENVKIIIDMISAVGGFVGALNGAVARGDSFSKKIDNGVVTTINTTFPTIGTVFMSIQKYVPGLVHMFESLSANLGNGDMKSFDSGLKRLKGIFDTVGSLTGVFKGLVGQENTIEWDQLRNIINAFAWGMNDLFFPSDSNAGKPPMGVLVEKLRYISSHSEQLFLSQNDIKTLDLMKKTTVGIEQGYKVLSDLQTVAQKYTQLNFSGVDKDPGGMSAVPGFIKGMLDFGKDLKVALAGVEAKAIIPSFKAVEDTVNTVSKLSEILASGDMAKMNVATNLKRFVDGTGLGQGGTYTIQNKQIVMNVAFDIKINAGELEEVLVLRKESLIKDAIQNTLTHDEKPKWNAVRRG